MMTKDLTLYSLQVVLEKSTAADKTRKWFEPGACFAAGTLVHTKEGLVPIEQIKVGDYVLSKHDSGTGKRAYKRVLNTFAHEPQRVIWVKYFADPAISRVTRIACTVDHPFWVNDLGWTPAKDLYRSSRENCLELANGKHVKAHGTSNIYISDQPGVGWVSSYDNDTEATGFLWDYVNNCGVAQDVESLPAIQHHQIPYNDPQFGTFPEEIYLHLPVYNLEVEDFHTYYVGEHGIWVHNTNCGGLDFELKTPGPALTVEMQAKPFLTRADLEAHLKANSIDSGVFLVRADRKSQVELIDASEIKNWAVFEDGVSGRIVASDKSRWEYGAVIRHPESGKLTYISVEGIERSPTGLQVFVDRKLAFVKAGNELGKLCKSHRGQVLQKGSGLAKQHGPGYFSTRADL